MTIKIFLYEASLVNNLWYSYLSTAHTTHNIRILKIFLYEASLVNNLWYSYLSTARTTQNIQNTENLPLWGIFSQQSLVQVHFYHLYNSKHTEYRLQSTEYRRANPFRGPFEGVGPESRDFFGPLNGYERSECLLGPKKSETMLNRSTEICLRQESSRGRLLQMQGR
jgi:hypothetical protein